MKRCHESIAAVSLFFFFLFYASLFEGTLFPAVAATADAGHAARVVAVRGSLTVERTAGPEPLKPGDGLSARDRLHSGKKSTAEISFADGSMVRLAPGTSLQIVDYVYSPGEKVRNAQISLLSGKVGLSLRELPEYRENGFRVQTRAAVVISRSTEFIVAQDDEASHDSVCRDGRLAALALQGRIVVLSMESLEQPVVLMPGMISFVCGPERPAPPRFATRAERGRLFAGLEGFFTSTGQHPAHGPAKDGPEGAPPGGVNR
ncbi:MAG: FecR family protein [Desulfobacteraceae bacterium]|nr:FecR family protein [Desulfobacteraceae bacterium]